MPLPPRPRPRPHLASSRARFRLTRPTARYLRHSSIARRAYFSASQLYGLVGSGTGFVVTAASIRYRRELRLLQRFDIKTRVVGWDEQSFFLESSFEAPETGFVHAVQLLRYRLVSESAELTPETLLEQAGLLPATGAPAMLPEVKHWVKSLEASSARLRPRRFQTIDREMSK